MKISIICLFSLLSTSFSAPTELFSVNAATSENLSILERAPSQCLDKRDLASDALGLVNSAGSSGTAYAKYTAGAGGIATSVCGILAGHTDAVNYRDCSFLVLGVASTVGIVYTAAQESKTGTEVASTRRSESTLLTSIAEHFEATGTSVGSISSMPISKRQVDQGYNSTAYAINSTTINGLPRTMRDRVSIQGIKHENGYLDAIVTTYTDGTGHIFTSASSSNATALTKRHDGPGFKINWRVLKHTNYIGKPNVSAGIQLAQEISLDWAAQTKNNINEYFATTSISGVEEIGLRIIAEKDGFGENYESVDVCGSMKTGHDEL